MIRYKISRIFAPFMQHPYRLIELADLITIAVADKRYNANK